MEGSQCFRLLLAFAGLAIPLPLAMDVRLGLTGDYLLLPGVAAATEAGVRQASEEGFFASEVSSAAWAMVSSPAEHDLRLRLAEIDQVAARAIVGLGEARGRKLEADGKEAVAVSLRATQVLDVGSAMLVRRRRRGEQSEGGGEEEGESEAGHGVAGWPYLRFYCIRYRWVKQSIGH
jgi:hypothetical protein